MAADTARAAERRLIAIFERSAIVRALDAVARRIERAWADSRLSVSARGAADRWRSTPRPLRLRLSGVALVTASVIHVLLTLTQHPLPGWRWLLIPMVIAAQGALLMLMSNGETR